MELGEPIGQIHWQWIYDYDREYWTAFRVDSWSLYNICASPVTYSNFIPKNARGLDAVLITPLRSIWETIREGLLDD